MREFQVEVGGITISSKLTEVEVSSLPEVTQRDMKNGYVWYALPPIKVNGEVVIFDICFYEEKIESVSIYISNPQKYGGWSDFSEARQKSRAIDTEAWLSRLGHHVGNYPWGQIWSGYDSKGGSGHGVVRYAL